MTSVNTNASATTALRTLQATNKSLDMTQNRISTGLKIGEAKDNAAYWAISTTLKSDNKSLATVKDALGLGAATVDTAYQGLNKAKEVLDEIQKKLTAATQDGVDRDIIQSEIGQLQKQLTSIASSSTFSGENWLSIDSSTAGYNSTKSIVSSFSRDANNAVSIGTIAVDISSVALFDSSASGVGILDNSAALKKADGTSLSVGGVSAAGVAPATQSLGAVATTLGTALAGPGAAIASLGTIDRTNLHVNDRVTFNLSLNGGFSTPVSVAIDNTALSSDANFISAINTGLTNANISGVTASNVGGVVKFTSAATGTGATVAVTNVQALDGDGAAIVQSTATGGIAATVNTTPAASTAARTTITYAAQTDTSDANDYVEFDFQYGSETYRGRLTGAGTGSATALATALNTAVQAATNVNTGTAFSASANASDVTVSLNPDDPADGTVIVQTVGKGADKLVKFSNVNSYVVSGTTPGAGVVGLANANSFDVGLGGSTNTAGTATAAVVTAGATYAAGGSTIANGDRITFKATLSTAGGGTNSPINVSVNTTGVTSISTYKTALQGALDTALGVGKVIVGDDGAGKVKFTTVATGENVAFGISNVLAVDGDGATASTGGLTAGNGLGTAGTSLTAASLKTNSAFAGPVTYDSTQNLKFSLAVDGGTAKTITINRDTINAALPGANGTISTASQFATVLNQALTNANVTGVSAAAITSGPDTGKLTISKTTAGVGSLAISGVTASAGGNTMSVATIDISNTALSALGVDGTNRKDVLSAYISVVKDAITKITSKAADLGSVASRVELQTTFVDTLMDTIDKGVGNLIDADLSEESTRLQALQTKQSLGVQALSIANSGTQNILRLFQ